MKQRFSIIIIILLIIVLFNTALADTTKIMDSWEGETCSFHPTGKVKVSSSVDYKAIDSTQHWYSSYVEITCYVCGMNVTNRGGQDYEPHSFSYGKCTKCGYTKSGYSKRDELRDKNMLSAERAIGKMVKVVYEATLFEDSNANSYSNGKMPVGSTATILDYRKNSVVSAFFLVRYNNTKGWVSVSNVEVTNGGSPSSNSGCTHIGKWVTTYPKTSNGRSGPGVQYQQISAIPANTKFKVYDCRQDSDGTHWLQIQFQGTSCWISEKRCQ